MQQNLFDGDSYQAQFAVITYRRLMSRRWVTYADIMAEFIGLDSAEKLPYGISKCEHIGDVIVKTCSDNVCKQFVHQRLISQSVHDSDDRHSACQPFLLIHSHFDANLRDLQL